MDDYNGEYPLRGQDYSDWHGPRPMSEYYEELGFWRGFWLGLWVSLIIGGVLHAAVAYVA